MGPSLFVTFFVVKSRLVVWAFTRLVVSSMSKSARLCFHSPERMLRGHASNTKFPPTLLRSVTATTKNGEFERDSSVASKKRKCHTLRQLGHCDLRPERGTPRGIFTIKLRSLAHILIPRGLNDTVLTGYCVCVGFYRLSTISPQVSSKDEIIVFNSSILK